MRAGAPISPGFQLDYRVPRLGQNLWNALNEIAIDIFNGIWHLIPRYEVLVSPRLVRAGFTISESFGKFGLHPQLVLETGQLLQVRSGKLQRCLVASSRRHGVA